MNASDDDPSRGGPADAARRADLVRINRDLDAQLRELVRGQERLFQSELESARQLARLESLAAFALDAIELGEPEAVLTRAASLIFEHFPFEQCAGFLMDPEELLLVPTSVSAVEGLLGDSPARLAEWRGRKLGWPSGRRPLPKFDRRFAIATRAGTHELLEYLGALFGVTANDTPILVLPLVRGDAVPVGLLLFQRVTTTLSFHEQYPCEGDACFLTLVARHVAVNLTNAAFVRSLEASYRDLERAQAALVDRERLAALGELAAQVAHEVRNPLGAIFNALSLLRPLVANLNGNARILTVLEEESGRINSIVSELLEFARPVSVTLHHEPITPIVHAAIEALHTALPDRVVHVDANADLPLTLVDGRRMRQALLNLLMNAAQAAPAGTPIRVRVAREASTLRIDVVNDGPSIPSATLARLFEPFFTTKPTGTGLGLSVVKRAVDAHGGSVQVASREGEPTVFTILLRLTNDGPRGVA